jgi:peptide deformylase
MLYDLVPNNDPILKTVLDPFDFSNPIVDPLDFVSNLAETMMHYNGIGLAANQVGFNTRVFVLYGTELIPCFNPKIIDVSNEQLYLEEGCLSYPGLVVKVRRPKKIKVRYSDPNGEVTTKVFDGITARAFQHENSHLDGLCMFDQATAYHKEQAKKKMKILNRRNK